MELKESAVTFKDEKGRTALHYACAEGSTECVRALLTARRSVIHTFCVEVFVHKLVNYDTHTYTHTHAYTHTHIHTHTCIHTQL